MIRVLTATTECIDDPDAAVGDIKRQLDCEHKLLQNSVGIISCHYEFALTGAAGCIGKALPFDTLGAITGTHGSAKGADQLQFTVMVLTSDDVRFTTALSPSLKGDCARKIEDTYTQNADKAERPGLILVYAPFMLENSGDAYVNELSRVSGGVPCFGTIAIDDTADFRYCFSLFNGEHYPDRMPLLFIYGDIRPRFFLATISQAKLVKDEVLITSSEGHVLKEVNGRPIVEYFEKMGLTKASETSYAMASLAFMLDYGDGTPLVARVFVSLNENKYAVCAGAMPEGAKMYMGIFDRQDVLDTTGQTIREAVGGAGQASGMLIYSCISRSMTLGADQLAEVELVSTAAGGKIPFLMAYSGGEICPTQVNAGTAVNRFHNDTCIICIF